MTVFYDLEIFRKKKAETSRSSAGLLCAKSRLHE